MTDAVQLRASDGCRLSYWHNGNRITSIVARDWAGRMVPFSRDDERAAWQHFEALAPTAQ